MPMDRYFCYLCNRIVKYGEVDPCFFYKDDDKIYTVPPPNESEATENKDVNTGEIHPANLNYQNSNACPAAEQNDIARSNETSSLLLKNKKISLLPSSKRKRCQFSSLPSKFLSVKKNKHFVSKLVSSPTTEKDGNTVDARQSKKYRKIESASAEAPQIGHCPNSGMTPSTVALGAASDWAVVSVAGLSGHQEQTHKTDRKKPLVCDVCGNAFSSKSLLERHMKTHTGDKPFVCDTCKKGFSQTGNLTAHLFTHTPERRFSCEFCGKGFTLKQHLEVHLRIPTGEKPYECEWCGRKFSDQSNFRNHKKTCKAKNVINS